VLTIYLISNLFQQSEKQSIPKEGFIPSSRAKTGIVSGGLPDLAFTKELIIDPYEVKEGEKQIFSVWAKSPSGVEKVMFVINTDKGNEVIEFKLVEGAATEGRWQGSWIVKDVSTHSSYSGSFQAINKEGKDIRMPISLYFSTE